MTGARGMVPGPAAGVRIDHLVIAARDLDEGVAWLEARLGVTMEGGGRHAAMGTHNRLLSLGEVYLEVIAPDPDAPRPAHPRWFDLDNHRGGPRLAAWVLRCDDLDAGLALAPPGSGAPMALARGDLRWRMAVPADGRLPFDGVFPALIEWEGQGHPAPRLSDAGLRLRCLRLRHPRAAELAGALGRLTADPGLIVEDGAAGLTAELDCPSGPVVLA